MTILDFAIYTLSISLTLSAIPIAVPLLGWDWVAVNAIACLVLAGAIAASCTLWSRYSVRLFWLWVGFLGALFGAYGSNVVNYFLSR